MARGAVGVELDIEHPLGDDAALARARQVRVLDRMLEIEQHARPGAGIALVHQHGAAPEQVAVALEGEIDDRVEQRMTRADEGGQRLARRRHERFLEGDALVARQHRLADADQAVAVAHGCGDVRHLVTTRLALLRVAAEPLKCFEEEGLDVVRLQTAGFGALHVFADAVHAARVHGVVRQGALFEKILQMAAVQRTFHHCREAGAHLRLIAVADGLDQKVAQRLTFELELAEHVEHLAAQGFARLLQLLQQLPIDVALAGLLGHQIPEVTHLGLADAVDPSEPLFQAIRIPRQVVVHHQMRALEVDAFAGGVGGKQHLDCPSSDEWDR